jgi:hypothetical protein
MFNSEGPSAMENMPWFGERRDQVYHELHLDGGHTPACITNTILLELSSFFVRVWLLYSFSFINEDYLYFSKIKGHVNMTR